MLQVPSSEWVRGESTQSSFLPSLRHKASTTTPEGPTTILAKYFNVTIISYVSISTVPLLYFANRLLCRVHPVCPAAAAGSVSSARFH